MSGRIKGADYFDDIRGETGGIHESMGLNQYEGLREHVADDGVKVKMDCRFCGGPAVVTVEWNELFIVGSNGPGRPPMLPRSEAGAEWHYSPNNHTAYVQLRCGRCGEPGLAAHFSPDEARQQVNGAAQRGMVSPQQIAAWKQRVAAARGG